MCPFSCIAFNKQFASVARAWSRGKIFASFFFIAEMNGFWNLSRFKRRYQPIEIEVIA
jgi:hypothetical protein